MSNNLIPKSGNSPSDMQKSNFAQTCILRSPYVKERSSFGHDYINNLGIAPKGPEPVTLNLVSGMEKSNEDSIAIATTSKSTKPEGDGIAPMTIFYGGQVFVFSDLSADKAREVIELAAKGGSTAARAGSDSTNKVSNVVMPKLGPNLTTATSTRPNMPIMPRPSLHRFFEKRKERIEAKKTPYVAPPKHEQKQQQQSMN